MGLAVTESGGVGETVMLAVGVGVVVIVDERVGVLDSEGRPEGLKVGVTEGEAVMVRVGGGPLGLMEMVKATVSEEVAIGAAEAVS